MFSEFDHLVAACNLIYFELFDVLGFSWLVVALTEMAAKTASFICFKFMTVFDYGSELFHDRRHP